MYVTNHRKAPMKLKSENIRSLSSIVHFAIVFGCIQDPRRVDMKSTKGFWWCSSMNSLAAGYL